MPDGFKRERECVKERDNKKQNNYDNIDTSIKSNPDARVSFKGAPFLHKAASFANDNPLVTEALYALVITCGLRPASIMATANSKTDKDKCAYQAAKSVSSGLVGLAATAVVATPIALATKNAKIKDFFKMPKTLREESQKIVDEGVETLKNIASNLKNNNTNSKLVEDISKLTEGNKINLEIFEKKDGVLISEFKKSLKDAAPDEFKLIEKAISEQTVLNNYENTAKNVADKFFQPIFMPIRAAITIALIPVILKSLGLKKPSNIDERQNMLNALSTDVFKEDKNAQILFQPFSGVAKHASK